MMIGNQRRRARERRGVTERVVAVKHYYLKNMTKLRLSLCSLLNLNLVLNITGGAKEIKLRICVCV